MKLLLENWKRYIKEEFSKEEQSHYKDIIPTAEKLSEAAKQYIEQLNKDLVVVGPDEVAKNIRKYITLTSNIQNAKFIGNGKFRAVFSVDKGYVVKVDISIDGTGKEMNQKDAELGRLAEYSDVFPKSFAPSDSYSWIILEKVTPIEDFYSFIDYFPNSYIKSTNNQNLYYQLIKAAFQYEGERKPAAESTFLTVKGKWQQGFAKLPKQKLESGTLELPQTMKEVVDGFYIGNNFKKVVDAMKKFKIRPDEIRVNNVGFGEKNRFVIIDSSVEEQIAKGFGVPVVKQYSSPKPTHMNAADVTAPVKK